MSIELSFLGKPQVQLDGLDLAGDLGAKALALMAYLAYRRRSGSRHVEPVP